MKLCINLLNLLIYVNLIIINLFCFSSFFLEIDGPVWLKNWSWVMIVLDLGYGIYNCIFRRAACWTLERVASLRFTTGKLRSRSQEFELFLILEDVWRFWRLKMFFFNSWMVGIYNDLILVWLMSQVQFSVRFAGHLSQLITRMRNGRRTPTSKQAL